MQFVINERKINYVKSDLIGDNADYIASFVFDSEWDNAVKTARFIKGNNYVDVLLENDSCTIPVEILRGGYIRVGVFSSTMTSTYCIVQVNESIKEKHGSPIEPTPDVYAQIIGMIEEIEVAGVTDERIEKVVLDYLTENPVSGVDEAEVQRIVGEYVEAHKDELKGEPGKDGVGGEGGSDINYRWKVVGTYHPRCQYSVGSAEPYTVGNQYTALSYELNGEGKIKFSGACGGTSSRVAYAFVDDNGDDVGHGEYSSMATVKDMVVDVPSGATKVFINGNGQSSPFLEVAIKDTMGDFSTLQYLLNQFGRRLQYKNTFAWKSMPTGLVAFTFDDSVDSTNEIVDLFISKGVPCCFGCIPELLHKSLSSNETVAQAMQRGVDAVGCEVLAHGGYIITGETVNDENYLYEKFIPYRQKIVDAGFDVRGIVRTGGSGQLDNSPITEQWVKLLFDYSDLYGTKEPYNHARVSVTTEQGYKNAIDSAIANKTFAPLLFHQPPEYLENLIDYAMQKGAVVCTYAYAYDTYGSTENEVAILRRLEALENNGGSAGNTPVEKVLLSISANKARTVYSVGEQVNVDDITVTAKYSDGSSNDVTSSSTIDSNEIGSDAGVYSIVVTYSEGDVSKTATISVTVTDENTDDYIIFNGSFEGGELKHSNTFGTNIVVERSKTYSVEADFEFTTSALYTSHTITLRAGNWAEGNECVIDSVEGITSGHISTQWTSASTGEVPLFAVNLKNTTISAYKFTNLYVKKV